MQPSSDLKYEVLSLEGDLKRAESAYQAHENDRSQSVSKAADIKDDMGWRERYLPLWLAGLIGGDQDIMRQWREQQDTTAAFADEAAAQAATIQDIDSEIINKISRFLRANDPAYENIMVPLEAAEAFSHKIAAFQSLINHALSEIDDAQSMETFDLVSSNKGISMMSTFANGDARRAVEKVKNASPKFKAAAQSYQEAYKDFSLAKVEAEFGDMTDLIFDFALDGFDFMSIFTLSALGRAEDNMEALQKDISAVEDTVSNHINQLESLRDACIQKTRQACIL